MEEKSFLGDQNQVQLKEKTKKRKQTTEKKESTAQKVKKQKTTELNNSIASIVSSNSSLLLNENDNDDEILVFFEATKTLTKLLQKNMQNSLLSQIIVVFNKDEIVFNCSDGSGVFYLNMVVHNNGFFSKYRFDDKSFALSLEPKDLVDAFSAIDRFERMSFIIYKNSITHIKIQMLSKDRCRNFETTVEAKFVVKKYMKLKRIEYDNVIRFSSSNFNDIIETFAKNKKNSLIHIISDGESICLIVGDSNHEYFRSTQFVLGNNKNNQESEKSELHDKIIQDFAKQQAANNPQNKKQPLPTNNQNNNNNNSANQDDKDLFCSSFLFSPFVQMTKKNSMNQNVYIRLEKNKGAPVPIILSIPIITNSCACEDCVEQMKTSGSNYVNKEHLVIAEIYFVVIPLNVNEPQLFEDMVKIFEEQKKKVSRWQDIDDQTTTTTTTTKKALPPHLQLKQPKTTISQQQRNHNKEEEEDDNSDEEEENFEQKTVDINKLGEKYFNYSSSNDEDDGEDSDNE